MPERLQSLYEFFLHGGVFMGLLLICSLVSAGVIILRGLGLRRQLVVPAEVEREVELLQQEDAEAVSRLSHLLRNDSSALGRIIYTGLQHLTWPKAENVEAVQMRARHEVVRMESGLFILEIIVGIAPLLGLLGAVSGLVKVFGHLGDSASQSESHVLASGIAEALSTTIVGLAIAIPSLMAWLYFSRKVEVMAAEMEASAADLLAKCYSQQERRSRARVTPRPAVEHEFDEPALEEGGT